MLSAYPVGARSLGEIMADNAKDTAETGILPNVYVFPLKDCFVSQQEAEAAAKLSAN